MAIKVIAQLREVKIGKNPGKKFVMRPDLYVPILKGGRETGGCEGKPDQRTSHHLHPECRCEGRAEEHQHPDHLSR